MFARFIFFWEFVNKLLTNPIKFQVGLAACQACGIGIKRKNGHLLYACRETCLNVGTTFFYQARTTTRPFKCCAGLSHKLKRDTYCRSTHCNKQEHCPRRSACIPLVLCFVCDEEANIGNSKQQEVVEEEWLEEQGKRVTWSARSERHIRVHEYQGS